MKLLTINESNTKALGGAVVVPSHKLSREWVCFYVATEIKGFGLLLLLLFPFKKNSLVLLNVYMCVSVYVHAICVQMSKKVKGIGSPRAVVIESCKLPNMGARN